ncbi:hypothetical protein [Streptomyces sp. NPDC088674]|uniref:hypothetical protein n=1 Tax=Streptomyces sp. NPDC088674 TaxID=3365869 RepID=UPI0037F5069B
MVTPATDGPQGPAHGADTRDAAGPARPRTAPAPLSGHAYPWDVLGDPGFPDRVRATGLSSVTLAATYHSTRAATPGHPARRLVDAAHSALYRPSPDPTAPRWAGARLRPAASSWTGGEPDPFGTAANLLRAEGLAVTAWLVLGHDTRLGTAHPDLTVVNCYGEHYRYALCPSHAEVRAYAASLTAEALDGVPVDGVSLEGCGQLGVVHAGVHEKTEGAWTADEARWLSVCCCAACAHSWSARGLNPGSVRAALRTAVRTGLPLSDDLASALLAVRHEATDALRAGVLAAVRAEAPAAPVTLHAHPDPWATGPSPGLTPRAAADVDALLVPVWPVGAASEKAVQAATDSGTPVQAYVTALPPARPDDVPAHARRLRAAGASGLGLYHLGLAPAARLEVLGTIVREWRQAEGTKE